MRNTVVLQCRRCGCSFKKPPSVLKRGGGKYCSQTCKQGGATLAERFWSKVNREGPILKPELGPCWIWLSAINSKGYGSFKLNGQMHVASRVAWLLEHGSWPEPFALHKCDGGAIGCVRPSHLYEGGLSENRRDWVARVYSGGYRGEQNPAARLSADQVIAIRDEVARGESCAAVAKRFGVSASQISSIKRRAHWKHV